MIPVELRPLIGNRIYGCDDCLAVCPWNKFARATSEPDFLPREELTAPRLVALAELDDAAFRKLFAGTAIKRTGRDRFIRNVLIAIGNGDPADPDLVDAAQQRLDDAAPLVRAAAAWAFLRLASAGQYEAERTRRLSREDEPLVSEEWERVRPEAAA
jgi:epoxyqueuosine reductase